MIRIGRVPASSDSRSCVEEERVSSRFFPRLEDLFVPALKFLDALELVFINDYRNVPFGRFLRSSYNPAMTRHQHRMIRAESISGHFNRKLHLGAHFNNGVGLEENSPCRDIDTFGVVLLQRCPQRNLKLKGKPKRIAQIRLVARTHTVNRIRRPTGNN
jgi:hypothetical protein